MNDHDKAIMLAGALARELQEEGVAAEWRSINLDLEADDAFYKRFMRADMVIRKKVPGAPVGGAGGGFFRDHNIIELIRPDETMTIDHLYKVVGYASYYKAQGDQGNEIREEDVAIFVSVETYPRALIETLRSSGKAVQRGAPGFYRVKGMTPFALWIRVVEELDRKEFASSRAVRRNADREDLAAFFEVARRCSSPKERRRIEDVLRASVEANLELYREIMREGDMDDKMDDVTRNFIEEELQKYGEAGKR